MPSRPRRTSSILFPGRDSYPAGLAPFSVTAALPTPSQRKARPVFARGDLVCQVVARTNADLQRVLDAIIFTEGVVRSSTVIYLAAQVPYRILPLVREACRPSPVPVTHPPHTWDLSALP